MLTPRTNHVFVALEDGTVLVAGGDMQEKTARPDECSRNLPSGHE